MSSEKEKEPLNCFNKSGQLSLTFIVSILWIIEETWQTPKTGSHPIGGSKHVAHTLATWVKTAPSMGFDGEI